MTLEDHLRKATRNFTLGLPEDQVFGLARELARELQRAHAEKPPRHPDLEPAAIAMADGKPRLDGGSAAGSTHEDLFRLGSLVNALALGRAADVSWRLDGPPPAEASTLARRAVLAALGSPQPGARFDSAAAASRALDGALAAADAGASAWPLFRGDPARSGVVARADVRGVRPQWTAPLGPVVASPVVHGSFVIAATADGRLVFLDRETGRAVHELKLASAIESSPALHQGHVYVGSDDGECIAVNVSDGKAAFRAKLGQVVRSSPLPHEGTLIVGVVEGKSAGSVVAIDAGKGKLVWKRKLGGAVFSSAALHQGLAIVGSDDGGVHALEPLRGELAWSHALGAKVRATPVGVGELALAADFAGRLAALQAKDGTRAWLRESGAPIYSSPCAAGGVVVTGNNEGTVHATDLATGAPRFEVATRGPVVSSALAVGERFLIGSTDGTLYLFDGQGAVLLRTPLASGGIQSTPAVAEGVLFVGTHSGVSALELVS